MTGLATAVPLLGGLLGGLLSIPFFIIGLPLLIAGLVGVGIWGSKATRFREWYATIPEVRRCYPLSSVCAARFL